MSLSVYRMQTQLPSWAESGIERRPHTVLLHLDLRDGVDFPQSDSRFRPGRVRYVLVLPHLVPMFRIEHEPAADADGCAVSRELRHLGQRPTVRRPDPWRRLHDDGELVGLVG